MKPVLIHLQHSRLQLMSSPHGASCGCGLCVTLGRIHFFSTHRLRDSRFGFVAATRLRILYTQLVDLAEGFSPATEIPGQPFIPDPRPPPGALSGTAAAGQLSEEPGGPAVAAQQGEPPVAPERKEEEDTGLVSCPKAKASAPRDKAEESKEAPHSSARESLPRTGENREKRSSRSRRRDREGKKRREESRPRRESEKNSRKDRDRSPVSIGSERKSKRRERRSRSARRRASPSFSRKRKDRPVTPERRGAPPEEEGLTRVKEERSSSDRRAEPVRPARRPSRDEGRSAASGSRVPHPPEGPPPGRSQWRGPIRAPRPDHHQGGYERQENWPKSKGVKRREKNRAFREANYPTGWGGRSYR